MRIEDFLSNDAFVMVNKKLSKELGICKAVYLQELISQRKRFGVDKFYFTQDNMCNELGISAKTQQRYAKELQEKGLINIEKKGIPARNWYTINDAVIINTIFSSVKLTAPAPADGPDYYNNNNKNNTNSGSNSLPKQEINIKQKNSELDKIKNSDDIRELFNEDEIQQYKMQLKILLKMVELGYKIKKSKSEVEKEFEWLKSKAKLYGLIQGDGNIAWNTFYQKIDKRFDWHTEKGKKVKNFKTSIIPFIEK